MFTVYDREGNRVELKGPDSGNLIRKKNFTENDAALIQEFGEIEDWIADLFLERTSEIKEPANNEAEITVWRSGKVALRDITETLLQSDLSLFETDPYLCLRELVETYREYEQDARESWFCDMVKSNLEIIISRMYEEHKQFVDYLMFLATLKVVDMNGKPVSFTIDPKNLSFTC